MIENNAKCKNRIRNCLSIFVKRYLWFCIFSILLLGCNPSVSTLGTKTEKFYLMEYDVSIGQTFKSTNGGLETISLVLNPEKIKKGVIKLFLYESSNSGIILRTSTIDLASVPSQGIYDFNFPAITDSINKRYYFELVINNNDSISVGTSGYSAYMEGAMYQNGIPNDKQLVFELGYDLKSRLIGILRQIFDWSKVSIPAFVILLFPGFILIFIPEHLVKELSLGELIGISAGLSASIIPIIFELTYVIEFSKGEYIPWTLVVVGIGILILKRKSLLERISFINFRNKKLTLPDILLLILLILIWLSRFWAIRNLSAPPGLDSIHHTAIVKLINQNGGLFDSWLPVAPYKSFSTHFGFHVLSSVYCWITSTQPTDAVLVMSQLVNALSVVAVYPLAMQLSNGNKWAGLGGVLAAGLLSPMPAFMVNWARYPQVTGQLVLPVMCWFTIKIMNEQKRKTHLIILGGVCGAGLFLSYYRLPIIYGCFLIAYFVIYSLNNFGDKKNNIAKALFSVLGMISVSTILSLPWLIKLLNSKLNTQEIHGTLNSLNEVLLDYQAWKDFMFYVSIPLLIGAGMGLVFWIYKNNHYRLSLVIWIVLMGLIVASSLIGIPGTQLMQNNAILMTIYIPLSTLFGFFCADLYEIIRNKTKLLYLFSAVLVIFGLYGAQKNARIVNPYDHTFITGPDLQAMDWIRTNTSEDDKIFILTQRFKQTSAIGYDAGWWISVLTERQTNLPPQYALIIEEPFDPNYNKQVLEWTFELENFPIYDRRGLDILCKNNFDYVYLGQYGRYVAYGSKERYENTRLILRTQPAFELAYQIDQVSIYKLKSTSCEQ